MPALVNVLALEAVRLHVRVSSKRQLFADIAATAAHLTELDPKVVAMALQEREQLGCTGVGEGVALPHARLEGLDQLIALFWQLEQPIEFEAIDDQPVDLVFVLLVPMGAEKLHLKTLARVARRLREGHIRRRLRETDDPFVAWELLTDEDKQIEAA